MPFHDSTISSTSIRPHPIPTRPPHSGVSYLGSIFNILTLYGGNEFNVPFENDHSFEQFEQFPLPQSDSSG